MENTNVKLKAMGIIMIVILILQIFMPIFVYGVENIATTKYRVSDGYVFKIYAGETVGELLKNISANNGEECLVYKGNTLASDEDEIYSGMQLKVGSFSYYLSVMGDLNGDGKVTALDLSLLMKSVVNLQTLKGACYKAADFNNDDKLTAIDISRMKMLIVGLGLPDEDDVNISGQIVINVSTTQPAKSVEINVQWPSDSTNLIKQISVDGGKTFINNADRAEVTDNGTVIARLVDKTARVIKTATLEITNIDNIPPKAFDAKAIHTIANYITLKGETDADKYYFSKNDGATWLPNLGLTEGEYTFADVTPNTIIPLRMKATDEVGNETLTPTLNQRTFKSGIDILAERLEGVTVNKENSLVTLPDGRNYKLTTTAEGSYALKQIGTLEDAAQIATEEAMLNNKVEAFEKNSEKTVADILQYVLAEGIGDIIVEEETIVIEKVNYYNMYRIITNPDGTHYVVFSEQIYKNGLTSSGQVEEQATIDAMKEIVTEMAANNDRDIVSLLEKAVERGLLLEENVNKNSGQFETSNGNVYSVGMLDGELQMELIGSATEVENGLIANKILEELANGIKEVVIDWAINDGITTAELANKEDGEYETVTGEYKKIYVDFETGLYGTLSVTKPTGAKISYTMEPAFPIMTNKVILKINAVSSVGVSKIEIISEIGNVLDKVENFADNKNASMTFDITQNAVYTIKATTTDGKVTEKQVLVSHISTLLPIKVTITPESARNTDKNTIQNGIATGPIKVTLQYSEALLLDNDDKYQFQIGSTTPTSWQTASKDQLIDNVTDNCIIYARYFDGERGLKQIAVVIDNVDNSNPIVFEYNAVVTSHSITVESTTDDTAADSKGNPARDGMAQILRYEYSLDGTNWQQSNIITGLTQNTDYTVYVKAIDYAGNEIYATNNGSHVKTALVPKASDTVDFTYNPTTLTNEAVTVTITTEGLTDNTNVVEYQIIDSTKGQSALKDDAWEKGTEFAVINNCKIYTRIVDVTGQTNPEGGYKIGNVNNIDNLAPNPYTPKITARTQTTLTVSAQATDAPATSESLSSGMDSYVYYLIPTAGNVVKAEDIKESSYTFGDLLPGRAYSVFVEAKDKAGNLRVSEQITTGTNAKPGEITQITTTVKGIMESESYNNPVVPAGFKAVNTPTANWGDDHTAATGWNKGLVLEDADGNEFVWVPVDGKNVKYEKWLNSGISYSKTTDGENPVDEKSQITKYKGFYVARYEAGKSSAEIVSKPGATALTGIRYGNAKSKAEEMYKTASVQSGLITGTQWDTIMKWIANDKGQSSVAGSTLFYKKKVDTSWGNYESVKRPTGYDASWVAKNIFDLAGNVQEITNELSKTKIVETTITVKPEKPAEPTQPDEETDKEEGTTPTEGTEPGEGEEGEEEEEEIEVVEDKEVDGADIRVVVRGGSYELKDPAGYRRSITGNEVSVDAGFRTVLYVVEREEYEPEGDDVLGIGNINKGPGNVTVNGIQPSYNNPVVPVGFKAINTTEASWTGVTPNGWNHGLVIEDVNGNQFVWVPVDGHIIRYEKGSLVWQSGTDRNVQIAGDELPATVAELGDSERTQIEEYQGFYIARFEAGNEEGDLASKQGLKVVNAVDYQTAKDYAETMYNTPYVKSGLPTGTAWDTMTSWIENQKGTVFVTQNTSTGNSFYNTFTFSGLYAVGPNNKDQIRGDYQRGEDVTKPARQAYLLGAGILEEGQVNNLYDLAGNVWEYTSEYYKFQGEKVYIARGSDYYRKERTTWGIKVRETITTPPGEKRNESGFRTMLYLSEGTAEVGVFEDYNRTMNGKAASYQNPIIPAGFAAVNKGANWGNGSTVAPQWNDGLVIEDATGNQFVWVPVDTANVQYKKWTTRGVLYSDTDGDVIPAELAEWNEKESKQVSKFGGFYVARYEISQGEEGEAKSVESANPWINITWDLAREKAESMVKRDTVVSGLITGTQWDTVMRWVANEKNEDAIEENSTSWGNYIDSTLGRNAQAKNIYEMAGGSWEWTAEYQGESKVFRGGVSSDTGASAPAGYRDIYDGTKIDDATGFRTVLYITGDVIGIAKKAVSESERLYGTEFPSAVNKPILSSGMTPMKYTGTTWAPTTADDPDWYDYADTYVDGKNTSRWANAMTPDGTMFVWVPRYAYRITYTNPAQKTAGGTIDVVFLHGTSNQPNEDVKVYAEEIPSSNITTANNYIVHPAFRNNTKIGGWDKELEGIWVAKHERGASTDQQGGTQYQAARSATLGLTESQKAKIDTHMAKNSEWGAVAYLSVSKYGSGNHMSQTTTGNIYGIYNMAGGNGEYTASYYSNIMPARLSNIYAIRTAAEKYKMVYEYGENSFYGDAFSETRRWGGTSYLSPVRYYTILDHGTPRPLFVRNGVNHGNIGDRSGVTASVWATTVQCSNTNWSYSYRLIIIPN